MKEFDLTLNNLGDLFPDDFSEEQIAKAKTVFLKELAYRMHKFYRGKMVTVPKAGLYGFNWFNVWYTPGVSRVSTTIRDNNEAAYELTNKGNLIAVVSDSTRVLGDGNCTPPGGLGVMEGKAFLMKYLGGIDAVALCINNRDADGNPDPDKIIDFVKMAEPSFGGINLEDISQPNCFKVLDTLREECSIPVWHDDAQGTGCVTLAGLLGALEVVGKKLEDIRIVFIGAGASNTTIARLIITAGGDPKKMVMFDSSGSLSSDREDIRADERFYRKWELCRATNPEKFRTHAEAIKGADALIAVSRPGPGLIPKEWIRSMARDPIVFACANPVPEIYPYEAKEAGATIVATGRGDFPNQVNNSLGFPGILKGALLVRARAITDSMAVAAARSLSNFACRRGVTPDYIIPTMDEADVFPEEAADVAMQAIKDGVARRVITREQAVNEARADIMEARKLVHRLMEEGFIKEPPAELIRESVKLAIDSVS
jgi:malate dehydrogenase (oxaloacetate-decarboxylating)